VGNSAPCAVFKMARAIRLLVKGVMTSPLREVIKKKCFTRGRKKRVWSGTEVLFDENGCVGGTLVLLISLLFKVILHSERSSGVCAERCTDHRGKRRQEGGRNLPHLARLRRDPRGKRTFPQCQ
jgi:hypothetical protein